LLTLETDKVSTEIVAEKAGTLETKVPEGQAVKIGEVVAIIDDSKRPPEEKTVSEAKKAEKPAEKKKEPEEKKEAKAEKKPVEEKETVAAGIDRGGPALSPAVRRIIEEEKLEPGKIRGTGEGGRLTKGDVLAAAQQRGKADLPAVAVAKAEENVEAREVEP